MCGSLEGLATAVEERHGSAEPVAVYPMLEQAQQTTRTFLVWRTS